ncbi:MAG: XRE family transcriptional regulator [Raoultibacter sp.]
MEEPQPKALPSEEPLTDELLQELLGAPTPQAFTEKLPQETRSLPQYLEYLLEKYSLSRVAVVRAAGLNETFGYQIFKGQRKASRNKILQLVFALHLSLQEANRLLQAAGVNELYCKNRRDALIIFCLNRHYTLQQVDEELYRFEEETIC